MALWLSRKHNVLGPVRRTGKHEFFAMVSVAVRTGKFVFDMARWRSRNHRVMIVRCQSLCNTRRVNIRQERGRVQPSDGPQITGIQGGFRRIFSQEAGCRCGLSHSGACIACRLSDFRRKASNSGRERRTPDRLQRGTECEGAGEGQTRAALIVSNRADSILHGAHSRGRIRPGSRRND